MYVLYNSSINNNTKEEIPMEKEVIIRILERMRKYGEVSDPVLIAYISTLLAAGRIEEMYDLLEESNLILILRMIAEKHLKLSRQEDLKLKSFMEKASAEQLSKHPIVGFFNVCMTVNTEESIKDFMGICDNFRKYYN